MIVPLRHLTALQLGQESAICHRPAKSCVRARALRRLRADDRVAAESAAGQIAALGPRATTVAADIAKPAEARRLVAETERALGPIDVLVNNAAIFPRALFLELTEDMWDGVLGGLCNRAKTGDVPPRS